MDINKDLFEVDPDEYVELRQLMVEKLVDVELDAPNGVLMTLLQDLVSEMYTNMDDDSLQSHFDTITMKES
jgi:hypothetical protein